MHIAPIHAGNSFAADAPDAPAIDAARTLFAPYLQHSSRERLVVAGFDTRSRLRAFAEATGGPSSVGGLLRLARRTLADGDVSILVVGHNHPSGIAEPSLADRDATRRIAALCRLAGVRMAGHLLFADTQCVLFGRS
jgi:DNA repair protein RadC